MDGGRELAKGLQAFVESRILSIATCLPVKVRNVHKKNGVPTRVDVQPMDTDRKELLLQNLPVMFLRAGDASMVWPIKEGDVGLAFFAQKDVHDLIVDKEPRTTRSARHHSMVDGFVLVGLFTDSEDVPAGYQDGDILIQTPGRIILGGYSGLQGLLTGAVGAVASSKVFQGSPS